MLSPEEIFSPENADVFLQMLEGPQFLIKQAEDTKIPGLANRVSEIYQESGIGAPSWLRALSDINQAQSQPAEYAKTRLNMLSRDYTYATLPGYDEQYSKIYKDSSSSNLKEIKDLSEYLISKNYMSPADIAKASHEGANFAYQIMARDKIADEGGSFSDALKFIAPALLTMIAPGLAGVLANTTGLTGAALNIATGATLGAGSAALTDQDILRGALTGAVGAGASNLVAPAISGSLGGGQFGNIAAGALTGGGIAELTGGDFLQGAVRGGVGSAISDYQQQLRQESR